MTAAPRGALTQIFVELSKWGGGETELEWLSTGCLQVVGGEEVELGAAGAVPRQTSGCWWCFGCP